MPPNGGFGGNTGIHDAHNLAWKLALVLKGLAAPALLATYEQERRPVGKFTVEQAYTRYVTRSATYLGAKDYEPPVDDFDIELGYLYRSPQLSRRMMILRSMPIQARHSHGQVRARHIYGLRRTANASRQSISSVQALLYWLTGG